LFWAAFIDNDFITLYLTLAIILIFKQIIMALIDNISPMIKFPKKFKKLNALIDGHIFKYKGEYDADLDKHVHRRAEVQLSLKE